MEADSRGNYPLLILGICAGLALSLYTIRAVVWKDGTLLEHNWQIPDAGSLD